MNHLPSDKYSVPKSVIETALVNWGSHGKCSTFSVTGESMRPFLQPGDVLTLCHTWEDAHIGDLIAFRLGSKLIVHRLFRIENDGKQRILYLKGDNRIRHDASVREEQVIGRVLSVNRGAKTYHPDQQAWQLLSRIQVLLAYLSFSSERLALKVKAMWFPGAQLSSSYKIYKAILRTVLFPGRLLGYLVWKIIH